MKRFLPVLLLLLVARQAACQAPVSEPASTRLVNVSSGPQFWEALADNSIGLVQLLQDVQLADSMGDSYGNWTPYQPLLRRTNLTVMSICGYHCSPADYKLMDFGFLSALIMMAEDVRLTFLNTASINFRKGAGVGLDVVLGLRGSSLVLNGSIGYRLSCSPSNFQTQALQNTPVLPQDPSRRLTVLETFCWRGTCYPGTLRYDGYSTRVAASQPENSLSIHGADAGYPFMMINATRLCASYWPIDCLKRMTGEQCNEYYTNQALARLNPAPAGIHPAVIAVPVAIGTTALLCGALAFVLVRRRRTDKKQRLAAEAAWKPGKGGGDRGPEQNRRAQKEAPGPLLNCTSGPPLLDETHKSWHLLACHTHPDYCDAVVKPADDNIQLGVLLGVGSSGRVYRGRWRGQDVAVKVMHHDAGTAAAVANEATLMLGFSHPNVVSAYHVISWWLREARPAAGKAAAAGTRRSSVGSMEAGKDAAQQPARSAAAEAPSARPAAAEGSDSVVLYVNVDAGQRGSYLSSTVPQPSGSSSHGSTAPRSAQQSSSSHAQQGVRQSNELSMSGLLAGGNGAAAGVSGSPLRGMGSGAVSGNGSVAASSGAAALSSAGALSGAGAVSGPGVSGNGAWSGAVFNDIVESDEASAEGVHDMAQTWLLQQFCDGGTLADAVKAGRERAPDGSLDMARVLSRLHDVACGMRYLHARNVLHRDLKASNVLLVTDPSAPLGSRALVADFGLSCSLRPGQTHHSTRTLGTVSHMAPELLRAGRQSPAADVYAFGICMWEVVSGRSAFGGAHYGEVFERVAIAGERPALEPAVLAAVGHEYVLLMQACWAADPAMRPTFEQVCQALDLLLNERMKRAEGPAQASTYVTAGGTGSLALQTLAVLSSTQSRWSNVMDAHGQQHEQQPVDGFF